MSVNSNSNSEISFMKGQAQLGHGFMESSVVNYIQYTVIHENFVVKKNRLMQNDEKFLLVILYTVNIWHLFDMNENIVTRKFLTKFLRVKLMRITVVGNWQFGEFGKLHQ